MNRRNFIKNISVAGATGLILPSLPSLAFAKNNPKASTNRDDNKNWRTIEITTQVSSSVDAPTQVFIPVPLSHTSYQELVSTEWNGNFVKAGIAKEKKYSTQVFYAQWDKADKIDLSVSYQVQTNNRPSAELAQSDYKLYLEPTAHIPLDGIVSDTAHKIIKSETNTDKKAKLIYNWIVENTFRDPKVLGCGMGDVKSMLTSGNLGGKCADLSALFVGLCRAAGIPAREVFGLRVLPSEISKSIGKSGDVTKGQHCRAEYYSKNKGWVPVDPADVRKVILEENLDLKDAHVKNIREKFFGFWEMNWIAYNSARDCALPPNYSGEINYFMYPRLVSANLQRDGMEPDLFKYTISAKEIKV